MVILLVFSPEKFEVTVNIHPTIGQNMVIELSGDNKTTNVHSISVCLWFCGTEYDR
jgi:hypothetical protein